MDKAQVVRHIVWIDVWPGVWIYYYQLYKCVGMWLMLVARLLRWPNQRQQQHTMYPQCGARCGVWRLNTLYKHSWLKIDSHSQFVLIQVNPSRHRTAWARLNFGGCSGSAGVGHQAIL